MNDGQLEGQMSIFDFLNEPKKEPAQVEEAKKEPICSYSEHVCNKNELFKVAESLDNPFCPHVCCRLCSDFECGARCNGANKTNRKQEELPDRFKDWIGSDYVEYICKNLRENELLEYTLKKIRSIKCNVNDSAFYKEFRKARVVIPVHKGTMTIKGESYQDILTILCRNGYATNIYTQPCKKNLGEIEHIIVFWKEGAENDNE